MIKPSEEYPKDLKNYPKSNSTETDSNRNTITSQVLEFIRYSAYILFKHKRDDIYNFNDALEIESINYLSNFFNAPVAELYFILGCIFRDSSLIFK